MQSDGLSGPGTVTVFIDPESTIQGHPRWRTGADAISELNATQGVSQDEFQGELQGELQGEGSPADTYDRRYYAQAQADSPSGGLPGLRQREWSPGSSAEDPPETVRFLMTRNSVTKKDAAAEPTVLPAATMARKASSPQPEWSAKASPL
jgi:hypothetical protein